MVTGALGKMEPAFDLPAKFTLEPISILINRMHVLNIKLAQIIDVIG